MRAAFPSLAAFVLLTSFSRAADLPQFADAPLRAVQFVDENEGWSVGDDGVVVHTIDGGQTWERQPTGVRASLRSLHFLDPFTGYIVGRESLPFGTKSAGVILYTQDGGVKWQRASMHELPGLHRVKFFDARRGVVVGDASDQFPTGVFVTQDGGVSWKMLPGPRAPGWLCGDFAAIEVGVVGGPWGGLAPLRNLEFLTAEVDPLGSRAVHDIKLQGRTAWAVGDGGLLLVSEETAGKKWAHAEVELPPEVKRAWDFHALHFAGSCAWIVGRPGSVILHTWDRGKSWQAQQTGQPLPLHGVFFLNEQRGWAVGELGTILNTTDGGKSWKIQRRGGHRAAVLWLTSRPNHFSPGAAALIGGGEQGYLCAAVSIASADPASASPASAGTADRFQDLVRSASGCAGELLWQFPFPQHLTQANATELAKAWGGSQDEARGLEELERQIVLALRIWRPDVVICDHPDPRSSTGPAGALVALVVKKAFERAGKADAHPEQIAKLDLQPWNASKLYSRWDTADGAQVSLDLELATMELEGTPNNYAAAAWNLMGEKPETPPAQAHFRLLASRLDNAEAHKWLLQGLTLGQGGQARRAAAEVDPDRESRWAQLQKASQQSRDTQALAKLSLQDPPKARQILSSLEQSLAGLPEDQAAEAAFAMGSLYANVGQWLMAKEVYLYLVDHYPTHHLAAEGCRWLVLHGASSEARRRDELNHFLVTRGYEFVQSAKRKPPESAGSRTRMNSLLRNHLEEVKEWYKRSLAVSEVLTAFGPLYADDPQIQFALQAAKRNLGDTDAAQLWYTQFKTAHTNGPWYDAASAELWLRNRQGVAPKPVATCAPVDVPPFLDGRLDDPCWRSAKPLVLRDAVGQTNSEYATEAWLAYDADHLYLALRCKHPEGGRVPPVKPRSRDADLRNFDRVSLLLDLDRDYATYFQLQVDQRGCVHEDCWGDRTWDPKWFVAVHSDDTSWQIEAAIPLVELTRERVKAGQVWACNVVRTIPGKGVQAFSLPADAEPRPEGMGLLQFNEPEAAAGKAKGQVKTAEKK